MRITGAVKIIDVPDNACLVDVRTLLLDLEKLLILDIPVEQITNVFVSTAEPAVTERDVIWYRIDNSGNFLGQFVFVGGDWLQMFPPPQAVFRMYGDSRDIPAGYQLIESGTAGFTAAMVSHIQATWLSDPTSSYHVIFDVVYVGL